MVPDTELVQLWQVRQLSQWKLLPSFRKRSTPLLETTCKCGPGVYSVPSVNDVPLLLHGLNKADVRVPKLFDIHCTGSIIGWSMATAREPGHST